LERSPLTLAIGTWVRVYRLWMTKKSPEPLSVWMPEECTLPTAEQPLRLAEFDDLFAAALVAVERIDDLHARLDLRAEPGIAARAADLIVRETRCCSFFEFAPAASGGRLALLVSVPPGQVAVLDALVERAAAAITMVLS